MDRPRTAGIGNMYARCSCIPLTLVGDLDRSHLESLYQTMVRMLRQAIARKIRCVGTG
jgi:hypothetical protein